MENLASKKVLVTGGMGFIGSHTVVVLAEAGARVVIVDDLSNSFPEVLKRIHRILGDRAEQVSFYKMNILNTEALTKLCKDHQFDATIHFAALKAVGESVRMPLEYYHNNIGGTISLMEALRAAGSKTVVFSSSCTVYGTPERVPIDEECRLQAVSPYGRTKLTIEELMRDCTVADTVGRETSELGSKPAREPWNIVLLRYFNPVAAHPSGLIGEHPIGVPQNLMPFVQQVATGKRPELKVFGGDYATRDGTAIRDYIHVMDLAESHVAALRRLLDTSKPCLACKAINVGTGTGTTVLEMIAAFEKACGCKIPFAVADRRVGDTEAVWAATGLAEEELGWKARFGVEDMCRDQWRWAQAFPNGYE